MSKILRDIYRDSKKALSKVKEEQDRGFKQRISKEPMYRLAEATAVSIMEYSSSDMGFEPIAVMGTASFERILGVVLSTVTREDRTDFLILVLTALYYKLAMGNEHAMLSDFHPSFINEEQDS